jgi:hypothetical protein
MCFGVEVWAQLVVSVVALVMPGWCSPLAPLEGPDRAASSAVTPKQEAPPDRVASPPPRTPPPVRTITLADEVVVKAMAVGQTAFLRCWARAQRADPTLISTKVRLHLEIDEAGKVTATRSDTDSPALASCLAVVARQLPFPAPGQAAVVDLPLMFQ